MAASVDVLIITALREELDALLEVTAGLVEPWVDGHDGDYRIATFDGQHGPLRVAAARPTRMAGVATATVATRLADLLTPACLAMCGVCAGHPRDTDLGDVVIADRVFHYDQGKAKPDAFEGDLWVHALHDTWLRAAQDLAGPAKGFHGYTVADDEAGQWWFIEQLLEGRDPLGAAAIRRHIPDARRKAILRTLRDDLGYVSFAGGVFSLTDAGRSAGEERRVFHGTLVTERPYHVHVGPIGSGNAVVADGLLWERLAASQGMRKTLAVEMEAASVGQVAHERSLPFVVVKGVMDRADQGKDDRFKGFAARASAEVLLGFLRRVVTAKVERSERSGGAAGEGAAAGLMAGIDNRGASIGQQVVVQGSATFGAMTIQMPGAAGTSAAPQPRRATAAAEEDVGEVSEARLVAELERVIWDPERAREVALAAGFGPGNIPVMKLPRVFWSRIVEDARNGAVRGREQAVADAAAVAFPDNLIFRRYRSS